jgi:hypothetical protein
LAVPEDFTSLDSVVVSSHCLTQNSIIIHFLINFTSRNHHFHATLEAGLTANCKFNGVGMILPTV